MKNNDIATLYFRNKHVLVLTIVILLIAGFATINNLPRLEDPRIATRNATILTFLPGASAPRIEALINQKIEQRLEEIDEIKTIESSARPNVSSISIELQESVTKDNNENIFAKIRSRLQNLTTELPANASIPFLETERAVSAYTFIVGISWNQEEHSSLNLLNRIALDFKDEMLAIPDTEFVRVFGAVDEEIIVTPNQAELAALNLSVSQLTQIIAASDSKISAGQLRASKQNLQIEVDGAFDSVQRIEKIPIKINPQGSTLTLGQIAKVERAYQMPPKQIGYIDGKRTIYIAARADENVRVDHWTKKVKQRYLDFQQDYGNQVTMNVLFEQNEYTESRLKELIINLVLGAFFVMLIVLVTMGWQSALVIGSVLPLAAAGTLFGFNFFAQSIHQMSIFGMLIAIGLLIDNAIVITDEVRKSIQVKGMQRIDAMRHAVQHLFVPLGASTLTTILGFMPIFLLPGNAGDFVRPIAVSVVLALTFSFFLSMTVIPALAASYLSKQQKREYKFKVIDDFKSFTRFALTKPKRFALIATILPAIGFILTGSMKVVFFPAADRDMFEVQLFTPANSSIAYTQKQVEVADQIIGGLKGVKQTHWLIGASTPAVYYNQIPWQDNNNAFAQGVITAKDAATADKLVTEVQLALNQHMPNARPIVQKFAQGPPAKSPVAFRILGSDLNILRDLGEQVRAIMHQNNNITHTIASIEGGQAKLWFNADEAQVATSGLNLKSIAEQFQATLEGFTGGSVLESVEELPVRVRLSDEDRSNMATVSNIQLTSNTSRWIPAQALGKIELKPEPAQITRYNGQRVNNVYGYLMPDAKAISVSSDILEQIKQKIKVPVGYSIDVAGESEQQGMAVAGLAIFAPILVTLMVATLILTFRSLALAGIVFIVGVLVIGLGMLSLKLAGFPLGFNPLIGSIGLAGVAINGSIVVIAAIIANPKAKAGDIDEIVTETYGCGRHMVSTTLTTIGGFVPLLLFSAGTFWPPLAVIIAGGMGFALPLTMFFTPLAYRIYAEAMLRRAQQ